MLDSMRAVPAVGMSILGENPFLERLDRGVGLGVGLGLESPPFLPLPPRLWHPTVWGSPPPCPPPPPPPLPLCPEPCHLPGLTGVGVSHLFDYMASARLWYPWYYKGESLLSGGTLLETYEAVGKELPTRVLKQERLKERQELVQVLSIDKDHSAKINARKSAGTQTQFSSFGEAPPYPGPPPSYYATRGDPHPGDGYSPVHHTYPAPLLPPPPPPHPATLSSPSLSPSAPGHLVDFPHPRISPDIQNAPLNLSLSSCPSTAPSSLTISRQQPRPSVITCAASSISTSTSGSSSPHSSHNGHVVITTSSSSDDPTDPAIEEHFRRSLGRSYGESISRTSATVKANVSITGSVDEHFAKSLGDSKWKAIKSKNDSVDDHFAKALGETTWRLIKAETEITENSSATASSASSSSTTTTPHSGTSLSAPVAT